MRLAPLTLLCCALALLAACHPANPGSPHLARTELLFQRLRLWDDRMRLARAHAWDSTLDGTPLPAARESLAVARRQFGAALAGADTADPATAAMSGAWHSHLMAPTAGTATMSPACGQAPAPARPAAARLADAQAALYECYREAAERIVVDGDTLNRLAILGLLSRIPDSSRRQRLFMALQPVWRSVDGPAAGPSPYRQLVGLRRIVWSDSSSPIEAKGASFGLAASDVERWIIEALERYRSGLPDTLLEPWDWYYASGHPTAALSARVPTIRDIERVDREWFARIGADPARVRVWLDIEARPGKDPVAFTDFAERNQWVGGRLLPGRPWISASYLGGGFDNLTELLHETGHAIHIAAIRTRPAYLDWPDDDTFTEALADVPAAEAFEPVWQVRYLGDSIPLPASLRAKYAGIAMDLAWALFEIRVHRAPGADPNAVWTDVTSTYLRMRPHPEWPWWAMRGQLVDAPGYLVNYALGAFITADLRGRIRQLRGPLATADTTLYPWLVDRLYRYGAERPAGTVLEDFLGRRLSPEALFGELQRMRP